MNITRKGLILILVTVSIVACALYFIWPQMVSKSPVDKFNFENCTIGVTVVRNAKNEVLELLTHEQCEEFVSILKSANLSKKGIPKMDLPPIVGYSGSYEVTLANGKKLNIYTYGDYLIINGMGYAYDVRLRPKINSFMNDVFRKIRDGSTP